MENGVSSYEMVSDEFTGKMIPKSGFEGQNSLPSDKGTAERESEGNSIILIQMCRLTCVRFFPPSYNKQKQRLHGFCICIRHKFHFLQKFHAWQGKFGNKKCTKMKKHASGLDFYLGSSLSSRPGKWFASFLTGQG